MNKAMATRIKQIIDKHPEASFRIRFKLTLGV